MISKLRCGEPELHPQGRVRAIGVSNQEDGAELYIHFSGTFLAVRRRTRRAQSWHMTQNDVAPVGLNATRDQNGGSLNTVRSGLRVNTPEHEDHRRRRSCRTHCSVEERADLVFCHRHLNPIVHNIYRSAVEHEVKMAERATN